MILTNTYRLSKTSAMFDTSIKTGFASNITISSKKFETQKCRVSIKSMHLTHLQHIVFISTVGVLELPTEEKKVD